MKRDLEHLYLKRAFRPVPEACHRALMDAARSVREEKPVKRISYRAALIAAVILIAAMAVAYAAVRLGWIESVSYTHLDVYKRQADSEMRPVSGAHAICYVAHSSPLTAYESALIT